MEKRLDVSFRHVDVENNSHIFYKVFLFEKIKTSIGVKSPSEYPGRFHPKNTVSFRVKRNRCGVSFYNFITRQTVFFLLFLGMLNGT